MEIEIMRELIIRAFHIDVRGLTPQRAKERIYDVTKSFCYEDLPNDIKEKYYIENVWLASNSESKVEIIYPIKDISNLKLDDLEQLQETISKIKEKKLKEKEELKLKMADIDPYGEENWDEDDNGSTGITGNYQRPRYEGGGGNYGT